MRWILVEATDRVLPEIDPKLADYAVRQLRGRGIEVRLGTTLEAVDADSATLSTGERVPTRTTVWTAGVRPHPSLAQLSVPLDEKGRIPVDDRLAVSGMQGVWAIGDCAAVPDRKRGDAPPTAQHAIREAKVVAANVGAELGIGEMRRYRYSSRTAFVNLGRYKAVGRIGMLTFRGFLAWWLARTYHLSQIPGAFRKLRAVIDWTVSLPFQRDLSEVGSIGHPRPLRDEAYQLGGSHRPLDAD
jgi:NADH:quinone reductase (non-electrogenic)